jgi:hypothetical protein
MEALSVKRLACLIGIGALVAVSLSAGAGQPPSDKQINAWIDAMGTDTWGICTGCPEDINGDGLVGVFDLLLILSAWGICPGCPEDINGDGVVDLNDLLRLLAARNAT